MRKESLENEGHSAKLKTTLMVKLPEDDRSGVLHQVLSVFAWRRLNLSKIESRPLKTGLGNYFFIIDVLESEEHPMMQGAMEELAALNCSHPFIRFLLYIRSTTVTSFKMTVMFFYSRLVNRLRWNALNRTSFFQNK